MESIPNLKSKILKPTHLSVGSISNLKSQISNRLTVIKDCAHRYFLSFVVEIEPETVEPINQPVGIDLGLKTFAVLSNGEKFDSPDYAKHDRKIRKLQRKLARQEKGANRRNKTRVKIAKLHNKIADTRKDFLHKLSTQVVN